MNKASARRSREERATRVRLRVLSTAVLSLFVAAGLRAVHLQWSAAADLQARAEEQRVRRLELLPARGTIYDRKGRELAKSITAASVFADPSCLLGDTASLKRLCGALGLDLREVKETLRRGGSRFAWIKRKVTPREEEAVRALAIAGVGLVSEPHRTYPKKTLGGQVLGFVGVDGRGLGGLEYRFDSVLRGESVVVEAERDARGCLMLPRTPDIAKGQGNSLHLTLDEAVQHIAEEELGRAVEESGSRGGLALVLDPATGEVLALAQAPPFNPNTIEESRAEDRKLKAVVDVYEPGSTLKALFVGLLLDRRLARPGDIVFCENGEWRVHGHTIHDHLPHGWLSVADILKVSSNIGVAKLSERLTPDAFYAGLSRFGLGSPTGVELPGESGGILPPVRSWSKMSPKTIAYGQGVSTTALQVASAISAIANGGIRMKPRLVRAVVDETGREVERFDPEPADTALGRESAATLVRLMERVVAEDEGTAAKAAIPGYTVAGKTGTSWKPDPDGRGYLRDKVVASFAGFVPSRAPRISILVALDEPSRGSRYGGMIAAPAFREMAARILTYLQVPPEAEAVAGSAAVAPVRPQRAQEEVAGGHMPDLRGLTMREVLRRIEAVGVGLRLTLTGTGLASGQDPAPGTAMRANQSCRVEFQPLL